jgi:hypothetical protein
MLSMQNRSTRMDAQAQHARDQDAAEQEVAIATMEEGRNLCQNGHYINDEVSKKKGGVYQYDIRAAQVIQVVELYIQAVELYIQQVVELYDAVVVDAGVAPTNCSSSPHCGCSALAGVRIRTLMMNYKV